MTNHKQELINALRLRAVELQEIHHPGVSYAPSTGRNTKVRRFENAMNQRKVAERLELPMTILTMGHTKWRLFSTPAAHNALANALAKLPKARFSAWNISHDA